MSDDVEVKFGANIAGLVAGVEAVKGELEGLASVTQGISSTFSELGELAAAAFAVEGIERFVDHIVEAGTDLNRMEAQLGMTSTQVNVLEMAAENSDTQVALLTRTITQFSRIAEEAAAGTGQAASAFEAMGINVKQQLADGRSLNDIFTETVQKLYTYNDSLDKSALMSSVLGGRSSQLAQAIKELGGNYEEIESAVERSGAVVEDFDKKAQDTKKTMVEWDSANKGVSETLFVTLKPAIDTVVHGMTDLTESFHSSIEEGGAVPYVLGTIEVAVNGIISVLLITITLLEYFWAAGKMVFRDVANIATDSYQAMSAAAHGHFKEAGEFLDKIPMDNADSWNRALADIDNANKDTVARLKALWSPDITNPDEKKGGGKDAPHTDTDKHLTDLQAWEAYLNKRLLDQQLFGQQAQEFELKFWQDKVKLTKEGSEERAQIEKKIYDLEHQLMDENSRAQKEAMRTDIQTHKDALDQQLAAAGENLEQKKKLWENYAQWLKQKYPQDVHDFQQAERQKTLIIDQEIKKQEQTWRQFGQTIFQSFNSSLQAMVRGTETWKQAVGNVFLSIGDAFLTMGEKMIENWIMQKIFGIATAEETAAGQITADAGVAGAAAYASTAAIPIVGPGLAPAAGAKAYTESLAFLGSLASFDVGAWEIGSDGPAMLHRGESVIPTTFAESMRQNGGFGGGGDQFTINAVDAKSFKSMLSQEGPHIAKVIRKESGKGNRNVSAQ